MVKYSIIFIVLLGISLSVANSSGNIDVPGDTRGNGLSSSSLNETSGGNQTCKFNSVCYSYGGRSEGGKYLGIFVDDSACGGLKGSCNSTTSRSDCIEGYKANRFALFTDAISKLCNSKECSGNNGDECFGLLCNSGRCLC